MYLFYSLRPKHWAKNLFIFLPLIFGKKLFDSPENLKATLGFALFCLASSAVYIFNDLVDKEQDRLHSSKSLRPIASERLSASAALVAAVVLALSSTALAWLLDPSFAVVVVAYLVFNFVYTYLLKKLVIIDVFCLGLFFLLRIVAGTVLVDVEFSHWMIFMVVLLALFLGFNKRRQEFHSLHDEASAHRGVLAKYNLYFIDQMIAVITSTLVVVYMLYTIDERTVNHFGTRHLYYTIPFVYYGIFRYLYLVHKRKQAEDPTHVFFSDRMTQLNLFIWIALCIGIIYFKV